MEHIKKYIENTRAILNKMNFEDIEKIAKLLTELSEREGRIFFVGVGGGAANAAHAVNDFRKICGIEAYSPTDNVSELTARINDDGWEEAYVNWLKGSRFNKKDMLFVFSVGGGNKEKNVSMNLVKCLEYAKEVGAKICAVVGRDGGVSREKADGCILIPISDLKNTTAHTESFQGIILHLLVSHPKLQKNSMKWESIS